MTPRIGAERAEQLSEKLPFEIVERQHSTDGRICKYELHNPQAKKSGRFELASYLWEDQQGPRLDINVSTMVGCSMSCPMCSSRDAFEASLTAEQIEFQVRLAIEERRAQGVGSIRTIVGTLGDGEPMLNHRNVIKALGALLSDSSLGIHHCRTSTTGVKPAHIDQLADAPFITDGRVKLQYSLMSADPDRRAVLVPHAGSFAECLPHLNRFAEKSGHRVDLNIALIDGMNDSPEEAESLANILAAQPLLRAKISRHNPIPDAPTLRSASPEAVARFIAILQGRGVSFKRFEGVVDDTVMAGCGQLRARMGSVLGASLIQIDSAKQHGR